MKILIVISLLCIFVYLNGQQKRVYSSTFLELTIDEYNNEYYILEKQDYEKQDSIQISLSGQEISDEIVVSQGKYSFTNGIYKLKDKSNSDIYTIKIKDRYSLIVLNDNTLIKKNTSFLLTGISDDLNNSFQKLSWKNGHKDGNWIYGSSKGIIKVFYKDGIKVDSTYTPYRHH
jgi:hypothetical protein